MATNIWNTLAMNDYTNNPWNYALDYKFKQGPSITLQYLNSKNWLGISKLNNPFSKGNIRTTAKNFLTPAINIAGAAVNKGASNSVGNTLTALSGVASAIPGWGWAAGAGLAAAGLIANGLTNTVNEEYLKSVNSQIGDLASTVSTANNAQELDAERRNWGTVDVGDISNWGQEGFVHSLFGGTSKREKARNMALSNLSTALAMRANNQNDRALGINYGNTMELMSNLTAFGGPIEVDPSTAIGYSLYTDRYRLNNNKDASSIGSLFAGVPNNMLAFGGINQTNGGSFSTGLSHVDKGKSHEENPEGGVQVGVDSENVPNLVEEGEAIYDDYVFSNRLIVPRGKRGNYGKGNKYAKGGKLNKGGNKEEASYEEQVLKPFEGLTFADAAKKAERMSGVAERPNDPIATRGFESTLDVLMASQEREREKEKLLEIQEAIDNMTPEEFMALLQLMQATQQLLEQQEALALQQLMIPQGMEQMVPQEQMMAAYGGPIYLLGGILDTPENTYDYGGSFKDFTKELQSKGLTIQDYLTYLANTGEIANDAVDYYLDSNNATSLETDFDKNLAKKFINKIKTISNLYNRRAKRQGIKVEDLSGIAKELYMRELNLTIQKSLSDNDYKVSEDSEISFNNPRLHTGSKNNKAIYNNIASYNDLIARGGKAVELDENGRPTWESMLGLNKVNNSADNFYADANNYTEANGIYNYKPTTSSSISNKDNIELYGWEKGDDNNYLVNKALLSPNEASRVAGNSSSTYKPSSIGDLEYGAEGYKLALDNIQGNPDYKLLTSYILSEMQNTDDKGNTTIKALKDINPEVLNYLEYLDNNSANTEEKLLLKDKNGNIIGLNKNAPALYDRRRNDGIYGIYHYQFDRGNNSTADRYYYMDGNNKVYITKPGGNFTSISSIPVTLTVGNTIFNDYEVTGLNKNRTLTLLPTGEVVDVTDIKDLDKWKPLDKPVLQDNKDNLGYGINGTTNWVDYGSSPVNTVGNNASSNIDLFPRAETWPYLTGLGIQGLGLLHNIFSPTDYKNADAMIKAALDAGEYIPIGAMFAGQLLPYNPTPDTLYGKIQGQTLGNARNIINNSRGNIGATIAGLNNNTYLGNLALGDAHDKWRQGNWNMLKDVQTFGLQRDSSNYDRLLKADMSNQNAAARAKGFTLEGLRSGYAMRQAIDDAKSNAISAGLSGIANGIINYGQNRYNQDVIDWMLAHNPYAISQLKNSNYRLDKAGNSTAKGGKLKRGKKGLSF